MAVSSAPEKLTWIFHGAVSIRKFRCERLFLDWLDGVDCPDFNRIRGERILNGDLLGIFWYAVRSSTLRRPIRRLPESL